MNEKNDCIAKKAQKISYHRGNFLIVSVWENVHFTPLIDSSDRVKSVTRTKLTEIEKSKKTMSLIRLYHITNARTIAIEQSVMSVSHFSYHLSLLWKCQTAA